MNNDVCATVISKDGLKLNNGKQISETVRDEPSLKQVNKIKFELD